MSARKQPGAGWRDTSPSFPPPPPGSPPPSTKRLEVSLVNISREISSSPSNGSARNNFHLNGSDRQACFGASPATAFVSPARNRLFDGSLGQASPEEAPGNDANLSSSFDYVPPPPPVSTRPDNQPTVLDRAIEFAVSRTADAIKARGPSAVFDDETDAQQLVDDFSAQFIELTKSDGGEEDFTTEIDDEESEETQSMRQRLKEGSRPSPFEVWSRRTELKNNIGLNSSEADKREGAKITPQQWESMVDRLYASLRQHNIQLAATQQALLERELMDTTFAPRINQRSRQLAANERSIIDRVASIEAQRNRKIQAERERFVEKERQEATFRPQINEHSRILAASTGSRLFDSPRERREAAQRKATEEREAKERINNTFSPVINNKSRELAVKGKALQLAFSPAKGAAEANRSPPRETFIPTINPESRRLAASHASRNVHERLYQDGIAMAKKLREKAKYESSEEKNKRNSSIVHYHPEMEFIIETLRKSKIESK